MASKLSHVIKKGSVAAARARRPTPSLLSGTLKIPRELIRVEGDDKDRESSYGLNELLHGERTLVSDSPFEVATRDMPEAVSPRKPREVGDEEEHQPTPEEIAGEWRTRLEEEVARARAAGAEEGAEAARREMRSEIDAALRQLVEDSNALLQAWEAHLQDAGVRLVQLAFRIARTVLGAPLPEGLRRVSEAAIVDAVEQMVDGVPVEVAVHPVSYLRLQEAGLEEQLSAVHSKLRWRSDPHLKENEWIVQSDRSAMRRLEAELLDELQRELSLRDHSDE